MVTWHQAKFDQLTNTMLYQILAARQAVFIHEQQCCYQDIDGFDNEALHLYALDGNEVVAYARILPPGLTYPEASIGRVLTAVTKRGDGLGKVLLSKAVEAVFEEFATHHIRISAQQYLESFYGTFGFERVGEPYLEDEIWHIEMLRAPSS